MQNSTETQPISLAPTPGEFSRTLTPEMLAEVKASGGHKSVWVTAEGMQVRDAPKESIERMVKRKVEDAIEEADLTRAQRRMRARRTRRPDLIQPVEIKEDGESEIWYLTALSDSDVSSVGILMAGDGFTLEDLSSEEAQHSFNAAILSVGLVVSEADQSKFFEDVSEAKEFYDDPRSAQTSVALRTQLFELNPFLFGSKKKTRQRFGFSRLRPGIKRATRRASKRVGPNHLGGLLGIRSRRAVGAARWLCQRRGARRGCNRSELADVGAAP